mmetsp:Transcript_95/g.330  ORF Transcript_95/g.330 Transcript_95/m.330 type:complete len:134 (+) Transcript_95:486-887(+)
MPPFLPLPPRTTLSMTALSTPPFQVSSGGPVRWGDFCAGTNQKPERAGWIASQSPPFLFEMHSFIKTGCVNTRLPARAVKTKSMDPSGAISCLGRRWILHNMPRCTLQSGGLGSAGELASVLFRGFGAGQVLF